MEAVQYDEHGITSLEWDDYPILRFDGAPPAEGGSKRELLHGTRAIACPRCDSTDTSVVSEFGSTACKASYKCNSCLEPFEYFKCI